MREMSMPPILKYLTFCITAAAMLVLTASPADGREKPGKADPSGTFLWKLTSDTNTVYLLGSIHVARKDFYPLAPEIEQAFAESKVVAVEVDVRKIDPAAMQLTFAAKGMYQGGETLGDNVSKETLKAFRDYCRKKNLPPEALEMFRPWALGITVSMLELQALGYTPELGIDMHFLKKSDDKTVIELESADAQIELLSGFGKKLEEAFLAQSLAGLDDLKPTIDKAAKAWKTGDVKTMQEEMIDKPLRETPEAKPVFDKLFGQRNEKMAEKIEAFAKKDEPHFVIVGAGHLIGEKGIVKMLEEKGYKLEQVRQQAKQKVEASS